MFEYVIVGIIVIAALFFTIRHFVSGRGCGCGHADACSDREGGCCCGKGQCH